MTCSRASLASSTTAPAITITVNAPGVPTVLSNTASVTANEPDPVSGNNSDTELTTVNVGSNVDLSLTKSDSPDPVVVNGSLVYTLTVTNNSGLAATNLIVTDTLPSGVTFQSAIGSGWGCSHSSGTVTCTRPTLAGSTVAPAINITVTAPATATTLNNSASVTADEPDPIGGNNNDTEDTTVVSGPNAELGITKSDSVDPVATSGTITYTLSVENFGPDPATNVVVTDTLPSAVSYVGAGGTGWSCLHSGLTITCTRTTQPLAVGVVSAHHGGRDRSRDRSGSDQLGRPCRRTSPTRSRRTTPTSKALRWAILWVRISESSSSTGPDPVMMSAKPRLYLKGGELRSGHRRERRCHRHLAERGDVRECPGHRLGVQ